MKVNSLNHLIRLASNTNGDFEDFYIIVANGLAKSSKRILYHPEFEEFSIIHEIDESYQEFHISQKRHYDYILKAINLGLLFKG